MVSSESQHNGIPSPSCGESWLVADSPSAPKRRESKLDCKTEKQKGANHRYPGHHASFRRNWQFGFMEEQSKLLNTFQKEMVDEDQQRSTCHVWGLLVDCHSAVGQRLANHQFAYGGTN